MLEHKVSLSLKQKLNGVRNLIRQHNIDMIGVLETKLNQEKIQRIMRKKFQGWLELNNFHTHRAGRILVLWDPSKVTLEPVEISPQVIHCTATCKVSSITFHVRFVYAFHSIVSRIPLWNNMVDTGMHLSYPWLVLGDFNNVL